MGTLCQCRTFALLHTTCRWCSRKQALLPALHRNLCMLVQGLQSKLTYCSSALALQSTKVWSALAADPT